MKQVASDYANEIVVLAEIVSSLAFVTNGERCFILADKADYIDLKRKLSATYRVTQFEFADGLYECTLTGSDDSIIRFHIDPEGVRDGLMIVQDALQMHFVEVAC